MKVPLLSVQFMWVTQVEGAKLVHKHELRLRMDAAIGRAPAISDLEMQVRRCPTAAPAWPTPWL